MPGYLLDTSGRMCIGAVFRLVRLNSTSFLFSSSFDLNFQLCWKVVDSVMLVVLSCESKHTSQKKNPPKSLGKIPKNPSRPAGNVDIQGPAYSEVGADSFSLNLFNAK